MTSPRLPRALVRRPPKVFCIGRNKTGTTSLGAALGSLGYRLGDQREAELLLEDWARRDFRRLVAYCRRADAFQDAPFSYDYTFQAVDAAFPGSKFVLTVRESPDLWFQSVLRYHAGRSGRDRLPTAEEYRRDRHVHPGWLWRSHELIYGPGEERLFDEAIYKAHYTRHNERVAHYFGERPADLLVLDVARDDAMKSLCEFLGVPWSGQSMPWLNRSS